MNKSNHNEMKSHLMAAAMSLAVNGEVPVHEIKERTDALREVFEQIADLEHKE
ncbi:hypothetical protein PUG46_19530 [Erwiniaceae bacterium L1_55_4]|nr:hypothetical protein [Erwiniaceae bacterium L1_55_4]